MERSIGAGAAELKEKMRQNLITSIEFLKQLLVAAKELLEAEKETTPEDNRARAKAALTALFETVKKESGKQNLIVENIVNDIDDQVVRMIRTFNDAFATVAGKREVRQRCGFRFSWWTSTCCFRDGVLWYNTGFQAKQIFQTER